MSSKVCESIQKLIFPIAEAFGIEVVEVEYSKKMNGMNVTVFIDKPGGISLEDCEKVHKAIDEPLDKLDPTDGSAYTLNVSSLGLDRPIKTPRDFERNLNKEIAVKLFTKQNGKKEFCGVLKSFEQGKFQIENKEGCFDFETDKTALIEPVIRF